MFYGYPKANTGVMPECANKFRMMYTWIGEEGIRTSGPDRLNSYPDTWDFKYPDLYILCYIATDIPLL